MPPPTRSQVDELWNCLTAAIQKEADSYNSRLPAPNNQLKVKLTPTSLYLAHSSSRPSVLTVALDIDDAHFGLDLSYVMNMGGLGQPAGDPPRRVRYDAIAIGRDVRFSLRLEPAQDAEAVAARIIFDFVDRMR